VHDKPCSNKRNKRDKLVRLKKSVNDKRRNEKNKRGRLRRNAISLKGNSD
jgi:hypothetical protein